MYYEIPSIFLAIAIAFVNCKKKLDDKEHTNFSMIKTIKQNTDCSIFEIVHFDDENFLESKILPTRHMVLPNKDGYFLVKGFIVSEDKSVKNCFLDIHLTERVNDFVIYDLENPKTGYTSDFLLENDVIPAVASDCYGVYELYYSRIAPEIGINVLKKGLEISSKKNYIAEDLGYILRDENRLKESLEYFLLSEKNGEVTSEYLYHEIRGIYKELGNKVKVKEYQEKLNKTNS